MSIKTTLKTSVAAAALFAVAAPVVSSPAEAGMANGNDNGVVISGSLVRSLQYVDNGLANEWVHTDGGTDNSRLRILVSGQLTESIKVGGTWEANLPISQGQGATTSTGTDQQGGVTVGGTAGTFGFRKTDIKFSHSTLGDLYIGQGSNSSDNKPGAGSTVSNNAGMSHGGGMMIYDKTANTQTALTAGGQFASYFGGRMDRIRYDTPSIMGFKGSVSMGDENYYDAGLTYGAVYGDITVAGALAYRHLGTAGPTENLGVGGSLKHASGLSASAHYGQEMGTRESTGDLGTTVEGNSWGVEAGYTTTAVNNLGATSFEIIYTEADETSTDKMQAESIQFHVAQAMPAGMDLFAAYEVASFDDETNATDLDDVTVFLVGTRLKF
jgi:hypothetical protein